MAPPKPKTLKKRVAHMTIKCGCISLCQHICHNYPTTTPVMFTKRTLMIETGCRPPLQRDPIVNSQVNSLAKFTAVSKLRSNKVGLHNK